jgi:hypothetical protein
MARSSWLGTQRARISNGLADGFCIQGFLVTIKKDLQPYLTVGWNDPIRVDQFKADLFPILT